MRVVVINHISLDGVMQGPGRADEDTRNGFRHGGWGEAGSDPTMATAMSERMGEGFAWLFGHKSYNDLLSHWNGVGGPMAEGLNAATKYVATSDPDVQLPWPNSAVVGGDIPARIASMRQAPGGNLIIMGSSELIHALQPRDLIGEYLLFIHPVLLGSGRRLFGHAEDAQPLRLLDSSTSAAGVVTATYQPI